MTADFPLLGQEIAALLDEGAAYLWFTSVLSVLLLINVGLT